ncbi:MAG: ribosome maturation factor RimP, partial [Kamptonema sp. SIO4C4]|nr:ribosome maturation factor RimP [Kamptonema sp. SIO4C4]
VAFKGFAVLVKTYAPFNGKKAWTGNFQGRDEETLYINQKGRAIAIPRKQVAKVQLNDNDNS